MADSVRASASAPAPIVIDTDPGVDDMLALLVALGSPELDVRAVTTTYGNVGLADTTRNAQRILHLAGRDDIPVAMGAARPLVHPQWRAAGTVHGDDGLGGRALELPADVFGLDASHAIDMMALVVERSDRPVTLVVIGPATNTALFVARYPELAGRLERIVMMGGAIAGGNVTPVSEFNIRCDPEAAHRVLTEGVPIWMVGLDVTHAVLVDQAWSEALRARGRAASAAMDVLQYRLDDATARGVVGAPVHDAVAVAELVAPGTVRFDTAEIAVETGPGPARGCTVVTTGGGGADRVAVGVDAAAAATLVADRIAAASLAAESTV